ncbi:hypothetical protein IH982_02140 [Patescibacteria group bacterium]|nr:hypothetical protein [Patescibacteria group bacterium]
MRPSVLGIVLTFVFLFGIILNVHFGLSFVSLYNSRISFSENYQDDISSQIINVQNICKPESDRSRSILCFRKHIEEAVKTYGISPFINAVEQMFTARNTSQAGAITQCHDLLHAIGQVGGLHSKNMDSTISSCSSLCTYGCYHGVVEGFLARGANLLDELPKLCAAIPDDDLNRGSRSACFHGLGHGVATIAGYKLKRSLELCDSLQKEEERKDCGTGVFMELYEPSSFEHPLLEFPEDIPDFCSTLWGVYAEVCYVTAGVHEYGRSRDEEKAFTTCGEAPSSLQRPCIVSTGQNFYFVFEGEREDIVRSCKKAPSPASYRACLEGALVSSVISDSERHGASLCVIIEEGFKPTCFELLGLYVKERHGPQKQEQFCESSVIPDSFQKHCLTQLNN